MASNYNNMKSAVVGVLLVASLVFLVSGATAAHSCPASVDLGQVASNCGREGLLTKIVGSIFGGFVSKMSYAGCCNLLKGATDDLDAFECLCKPILAGNLKTDIEIPAHYIQKVFDQCGRSNLPTGYAC